MVFINKLDSFLPNMFENIANPFLDSLMVFVSKLGDGGFIWIITIIVLLMSKRGRKTGIIAAISFVVCFFTGNYIIKPLVGRIRPCNLYPFLRMLISRPSDFSFPSMHAATAFSVSAVLFAHNKKMGIPALILAMLISLSRVYLNVHFTSDIIMGILYGIFVSLCTEFVIKKTKLNRADY